MNFAFPINRLSEYKSTLHNNCTGMVTGVATKNSPKSNSIIFLKRLSKDDLQLFSTLYDCIILTMDENQFRDLDKSNFIIKTANPRLEFAKLIQFILNKTIKRKTGCFASLIGDNVHMGDFVLIEDNVIIGNNVIIGSDSTIKAGTIIGDNVTIGDHTTIRENSVIGGSGFGFERDENNVPIRIPHIAGVNIGNYVEIGALNTVVAGTIEPTLVMDGVKTDDHVHIAHNCKISKNCLITACVELSGSVTVGENTWLGPNCSIMNGITIGANCCIGLGTVITKSIKDNQVIAGNPGLPIDVIKENKIVMKKMYQLIENQRDRTV